MVVGSTFFPSSVLASNRFWTPTSITIYLRLTCHVCHITFIWKHRLAFAWNLKSPWYWWVMLMSFQHVFMGSVALANTNYQCPWKPFTHTNVQLPSHVLGHLPQYGHLSTPTIIDQNSDKKTCNIINTDEVTAFWIYSILKLQHFTFTNVTAGGKQGRCVLLTS